ncbi:MAG: carboxylating nicotinate-nucleotide diphosphorylase [Elusimicrobia bacterium]|nr:carboxylating nicotinate-nucleotide diphosphorylase [Elusimicrobiota bacterium]
MRKGVPTLVRQIVHKALEEDQASKDVTSQALLDPKLKVRAVIVAKEAGVLCGTGCAQLVFRALDPKSQWIPHLKDGERVTAGEKVLSITGNARKILAGERVALNFLQHLSGIATLTSRFVTAVRGTKAKIYDTRKTVPGLRFLQKYAVRCGGGTNHRTDLAQAAMIKDNHLKILKASRVCMSGIKDNLPKGTILILEAENLSQIQAAVQSRAEVILLDNMPLPKLKRAIHLIRSSAVPPIPQIEVSGGVSLRNVRAIAKLGMERISVGALTHSAPALDISLEIEKIG